MVRITPEVRKYLQSITRKGGQSKSRAKAAASRRNGKLGGRPRTYQPCPRCKAHRFIRRPDGAERCPCGFERP